jgi:Uma2 family endonuclease
MSAAINKKLFRFDEYLRMAEMSILSRAERTELIQGEILLMSPIGPRHCTAIDRTVKALIQSVDDKAIVRSQSTVVLDPLVAPEPDIALLRPTDDDYVSEHPGPEDILLLIEVADSSLDYDMTVKRGLYAILGIPEYWIADLRNNRLLVYSKPEGDSYLDRRELHRGDNVTPGAFPGCSLAVDLMLP